MSIGLAPRQTNTLAALRSFLLAVLPAGVEVVQGQGNRVPEPQAPDFVVFTPLSRERIETNVDGYEDAAFIGSIAGNQMTISRVLIGALAVGNQISGDGVTAGTVVTSGAGGVGVYTISPAQTVASTILQAGATSYLQPTKLTVQVDVHGPNSADNAQIISTLFRDDYAVEFFAAMGPDPIPLYADDPKQVPFSNEALQVEDRWIVEALLQTNQVVTAPQQFADTLKVLLVDVDEKYPPS